MPYTSCSHYSSYKKALLFPTNTACNDNVWIPNQMGRIMVIKFSAQKHVSDQVTNSPTRKQEEGDLSQEALDTHEEAQEQFDVRELWLPHLCHVLHQYEFKGPSQPTRHAHHPSTHLPHSRPLYLNNTVYIMTNSPHSTWKMQYITASHKHHTSYITSHSITYSLT